MLLSLPAIVVVGARCNPKASQVRDQLEEPGVLTNSAMLSNSSQ